MNKKSIEAVCREVRLYGLVESYYYVMYNITHNVFFYTKQLLKRKDIYEKMNAQVKKEMMEKIYYYHMGEKIDINNPNTFLEKIQWIKNYDITPDMVTLADKYSVREWVTDKIGEKYLIPILGVWNDISAIDFNSLPNRFCLKTTHGSAMNIVVNNKNQLNIEWAKYMLKNWLDCPFEMVSYEMQYRDISHRIIAEEYMEELDGALLDYKIHCFNGEPRFIQCIGERDNEKHTAFHDHFDLDWNVLDWNFECFPRFPYVIDKPENLEEMINIAQILSKNFKYVRVDLYNIKGKIYFGEMTFTPGSGMYPYKNSWTYEKDLEIGKLLEM